MKASFGLLLPILLATPAYTAGTVSEVITGPIRVIDGDTVELSSEERVRIYNIDAPEIGHARCQSELVAGQRAKVELEQLLEQRPVTISRCEASTGRCLDKYHRTLATLRTPIGDVGAMLVHQGLALPWEPGKEAHDERARHWCGGEP